MVRLKGAAAMDRRKTTTRELFSSALQYVLKTSGKTQHGIATSCGMATSTLNNYSTGKREGDEDTRRRIAAALGYTYEDMLSLGQWIIEGKDPVEFQKTGKAHQANIRLAANVTAGPDIIGGIPLISFVQAGGWVEIVDNLQPGDAEEWIPRISGVGPRSFALRVSGTSMAPDYQPGDIIVVDPDCQHNNGSLVVARLNGDNEATFKRIVIDGGKTFLEPINQRYQPLDITGRDVTICGVVRQMLRNVQ
jgi:SOS-response transcriptional repressor LexA